MMKRISILHSPARAGRLGALLLVLPFLLSSCVSYDSWNRTTTGMSLGAFFGSTVGGILGGNRGADLGTLIGGATGAAIGAASAAKNEEQRARTYDTYNNVPRDGRYGNEQVGYGRYNEGSDGYATFNGIELSNLTFSDYNGDRCLQPGERAQISFDLYNNSGSTLYNIAPVVSCDYKRVNVSPTAIIGELPSGRSVRYQAEVVARNNARQRELMFQVALPTSNGRLQVMKSFSIELLRR